jgi:hypothetical protein
MLGAGERRQGNMMRDVLNMYQVSGRSHQKTTLGAAVQRALHVRSTRVRLPVGPFFYVFVSAWKNIDLANPSILYFSTRPLQFLYSFLHTSSAVKRRQAPSSAAKRGADNRDIKRGAGSRDRNARYR